MSEYRMRPENSAAAMERIASTLTPVQQSVLVSSVQQSDRRDVYTVSSANERTVASLSTGVSPLVRENRVKRRVLTDLGVDVAKYLISTGRFPAVDLDAIVPDLSTGTDAE